MKPLSDRSRRVMQFANREALALGHPPLEPEHILLGILKEGTALTETVLQKIDRDFSKIRRELNKHMPDRTSDQLIAAISKGKDVTAVLETADAAATDLNSETIIPEHILVALIETPETHPHRTFANLSIVADDVLKDLEPAT